MSGQLDLCGQPALTPPDLRLTIRQRLALDYIQHHAPVPNDELGAALHEERRARGLRGHSADERCEWCADEGRQMGAALRAKDPPLVRHRNGAGGGWYLAGQCNRKPRENSQPGPDDPFPNGY